VASITCVTWKVSETGGKPKFFRHLNTPAASTVEAPVAINHVLSKGTYMKLSIPKFLLVGAALATLSLTSGCSQESSSAQPTTSAPPVVTTPPVTTVQAAPALSAAPELTAATAEVPPTTEKPATIPPSIAPTSPLAQVVRLAQAGVDESIIMVYVTNSSRTFNLDADKIVYLTDLGLPTEVVTAMMAQDLQLQQAFAASQAEQQAQQAQQMQQTQQTQQDQQDQQDQTATEPAPASTAETVAPPAPVTENYFNDTLSPYGSWVVVNGYGRCWRPAVCTYNPGWQPYCDRGHWVYTDCGWYWSSDYSWGATFHYGRWFRDTRAGWCWSPDTVWAPSWVTWRYSNNYCGWAPLPPRTYCQPGVGIVYQGGNVGVSLRFGLGASCFTFVPTQYFCSSHPRNHCVPPSQTTQIYNNTTVINNIRIHGSGHNQIVVNNGIPVQGVVNASQTPIRPVPVHKIDDAFAHGGSSQLADRPSRVSTRPGFNGNAGNPVQASEPSRTEPATVVSGQNPPRSTVIAGNNASRSGQNRFQQPVNNQNQQARQGQFNQGQARMQPERNTPTSPQRPVASANNNNPQTTTTRWQQPPQGTPHNYTRTPEPRQNLVAQSRVVAPPVTYSAPPQPQPQVRSYNQPRAEVRQSYSPPPVMSAPQRSAPSVVSAPAPQSQSSGRMGNPNWGTR